MVTSNRRRKSASGMDQTSMVSCNLSGETSTSSRDTLTVVFLTWETPFNSQSTDSNLSNIRTSGMQLKTSCNSTQILLWCSSMTMSISKRSLRTSLRIACLVRFNHNLNHRLYLEERKEREH
jgi:hypothetical protein